MAPENLIELSNRLAEIVREIAPAVVRVEGRRRGGSTGVVWSNDVIVTTSHALERDEEIRVGTENGESVARLIGRDPSTDIAALRVEGGKLSAPRWSGPEDVRVGHLVLGLSRPGRTVRASLGIVAARTENWRAPSGARFEHYLESDLPLRRGFSGGPLVDAGGRLLAMNTSGVLRGAPFAVSTPTLARVIPSLVQHGRVRRGHLGIGAYPVKLPAALAEKAGRPSGLLLLWVAPESPASRAGLLLGDVLVSLGGKPVSRPGDLIPLLDEERIGKETVAGILRGGEVRELPITVGLREGEGN